jgi:LysR family glycine cleavage system transcriptional activator
VSWAYRLPPLAWLRSFEAAARHMSFTAAGDELGLTSAAISQQVRSLEQHLGYPLFERLARGLRLTDMGRAYLSPIRKAFDELSASTAGLFGAPAGTQSVLNIRVPISFSVLRLAPILNRFTTTHPNIAIRLFTAVWADALPEEKVDIDIRFGHGRWPGYAATLIYNEPSVAVTATKAADVDLAEVPFARLIHIMGIEDEWLRYHRLRGLERKPAGAPLTVDTSLAALELAAAGNGLAIVLKNFALSPHLGGRVRLAYPDELPQEQSHYLLSRDGSGPLRPEALLFRDWLIDELRISAG